MNDLSMAPFDRIVSLGGHCEPAHHLRRTGRYQTNSPFDWLVTPLHSLTAILEERGARLGTTFVATPDGTSASCAAYGVLCHHEFPRSNEGRVHLSVETAATCRSKLAHKMETFLRVCSGPERILFLRQSVSTDLSWDPARCISSVDADVLVGNLVNKLEHCFPSTNFHLLIVQPETDIHHLSEQRKVTITRLPRQQKGWFISDSEWDILLAGIAYSAPHGVVSDELLYGI